MNTDLSTHYSLFVILSLNTGLSYIVLTLCYIVVSCMNTDLSTHYSLFVIL